MCASVSLSKVEFARRAGGQVVRWICVDVFALRRSVSFYGTTNWNLPAGRAAMSCARYVWSFLPCAARYRSSMRQIGI